MSVSRRRLLAATAAGFGNAAAATRAAGGQAVPSAVPVVAGLTTWDQTVQRASYTAPGYQTLIPGLGEPHVVRTDLRADQNPPTMALAAFAQMTDLHIVDDQSPARVEFMDRYADASAPHLASYPTDSAYRQPRRDVAGQPAAPLVSSAFDSPSWATGSKKIQDTTKNLPDNYSGLGSYGKLAASWGLFGISVAPDANRRLLSRKAFIQDHFNTASFPGPVGHGFQGVGIDKAYYAIPFGASDLVRYITLDSTNTHTDGLGSGDAGGSIDDVQFNWLEQQLIANSSSYVDDNGRLFTRGGVADKLYVIFCHHTLGSMGNLDDGTIFGTGSRRYSGDELKALLLRFPSVIAMVNGHTHANKIIPPPRTRTSRTTTPPRTAGSLPGPRWAAPRSSWRWRQVPMGAGSWSPSGRTEASSSARCSTPTRRGSPNGAHIPARRCAQRHRPGPQGHRGEHQLAGTVEDGW